MADGYVQQAALKVFIKVVACLLHFGRNCSSLAYKHATDGNCKSSNVAVTAFFSTVSGVQKFLLLHCTLELGTTRSFILGCVVLQFYCSNIYRDKDNLKSKKILSTFVGCLEADLGRCSMRKVRVVQRRTVARLHSLQLRVTACCLLEPWRSSSGPSWESLACIGTWVILVAKLVYVCNGWHWHWDETLSFILIH